uniref:hypothetical protein n=1 Tax=Pseudooctadecabacter sp. TaxID=1966338 RepID=UPI0025E4014F
MIRVSCDQNANLKRLRRLETEGRIELYATNIEGLRETRRISDERKLPPLAVYDSEHATYGNMVLAADDNPWSRILKLIGRSNMADAHHFETHIRHGHDVFVTSDRDILDHRDRLQSEFDTKIMTDEELE